MTLKAATVCWCVINISRGWKGKDCKERQTILGLRREILSKGWILNKLFPFAP